MYYYILGAVVIGLLIWTVASYVVIRSIEEPAYTVLEQRDGYEVRQYEPYIMATTNVTGDYNEATRQGFRIIADYIFGNNTQQESIAMTAPVLEGANINQSQKIAMTIPVLETESGSATRTIAFVLPSKYTLETLPLPNNKAVIITPVPARKVAALSFTWYPTAARVEAKKTMLKELLARDKTTAIGSVETARYNPPLSMPLMLRNEVLISIQ